MKDIIDFVEKNSSFSFEGDPDEEQEVCKNGKPIGGTLLEFGTRENGNVHDEEYSDIDYKSGQEVIVKAMEKFNHLIERYELDTCDEWVNLRIFLNE